MGKSAVSVTYAPVGDAIDNGFELGGSRFYPWSTGFAITPPAEYSDYIGTGGGNPVDPPVGALPSTIGDSNSSQSARMQAAEHPFGRTSPLPWVVIGLIGAVIAAWYIHYKEG